MFRILEKVLDLPQVGSYAARLGLVRRNADIPHKYDKITVGRLPWFSDAELYEVVGRFSKKEIANYYKDDPWFQNVYLNFWEYITGETVLDSYPWNISLPIADLCNARCTFCDSWLRGEGFLKPEDLNRFREVLRYARVLGIQGHGEPLANPHIDEILNIIADTVDQRCRAFIITNGVYLPQKLDALLEAHVTTFNLSLNGVSQAVHDKVMGLGERGYEKVQDGLAKLLRVRNEGKPDLEITISLVLTKDNIEEAAEFVRMGNTLGVNTIYIRTLMPVGGVTEGLNYHVLPPYLHPDFSALDLQLREAIKLSEVRVIAQPDTWGSPVMSEEAHKQFEQRVPAVIPRSEAIKNRDLRKFYRGTAERIVGYGRPDDSPIDVDGPNPYDRNPRFLCRFVYHNLICNELNFRFVPCCYMANVPGYEPVVFDGTQPFMSYWNSPAFVALRSRLKEGPLLNPCKTCPMQS